MNTGLVGSASEELLEENELVLVIEEQAAEPFIWFISYR